ncbi:hypothetical protein BJX99DRAFT_570 [Aspergillus californicus]
MNLHMHMDYPLRYRFACMIIGSLLVASMLCILTSSKYPLDFSPRDISFFISADFTFLHIMNTTIISFVRSFPPYSFASVRIYPFFPCVTQFSLLSSVSLASYLNFERFFAFLFSLLFYLLFYLPFYLPFYLLSSFFLPLFPPFPNFPVPSRPFSILFLVLVDNVSLHLDGKEYTYALHISIFRFISLLAERDLPVFVLQPVL